MYATDGYSCARGRRSEVVYCPGVLVSRSWSLIGRKWRETSALPGCLFLLPLFLGLRQSSVLLLHDFMSSVGTKCSLLTRMRSPLCCCSSSCSVWLPGKAECLPVLRVAQYAALSSGRSMSTSRLCHRTMSREYGTH